VKGVLRKCGYRKIASPSLLLRRGGREWEGKRDVEHGKNTLTSPFLRKKKGREKRGELKKTKYVWVKPVHRDTEERGGQDTEGTKGPFQEHALRHPLLPTLV